MRRRVTPASAGTVATGVALAGTGSLTALVPFAVVAALVAGDLRGAAGVAAMGLFLGGWCAVTLRVLRSGVYTGPDGVRIRRVLRTTTPPWPTVAAVESRPGHAFGVEIGREAIWIVRTAGEPVETPLQRRAGRWPTGSFDHELTLLAPPAYDRALAALRSGPTPGTGVGPRVTSG